MQQRVAELRAAAEALPPVERVMFGGAGGLPGLVAGCERLAAALGGPDDAPSPWRCASGGCRGLQGLTEVDAVNGKGNACPCGSARYCCRDPCQRSAWRAGGHKAVCERLRAAAAAAASAGGASASSGGGAKRGAAGRAGK